MDTLVCSDQLLLCPAGVGIYDFWMGRELNPRWGSWLDLKEFCELYPGMIGWTLLNLAAAYRQYTSTGHVTYSLLLVNAFHLWYVLDTVVNEPKILTTMDITSEGFGFMLAFGDLAWVPFTYTTQARYLVDHPQVGWGGCRQLTLKVNLGWLATDCRSCGTAADATNINPITAL